MISIFVNAKDTDGQIVIADHYQFKSVPRMGETVLLDNRETPNPLRVVAVINHAEPKGDVMNPLSYIELICEAIG
jgi:hypothetical protein